MEATFKGADTNTIMRNLNKSLAKMKEGTAEGMTTALLFLRGEAMKETPVMTGNLRGSSYCIFPQGKATRERGFKGEDANEMKANHQRLMASRRMRHVQPYWISGEIGFSAKYAMSVHENPRSGRTRGYSPSGKRYAPPKGSKQIAYARSGAWKFLERPVIRNKRKLLRMIASKAKL